MARAVAFLLGALLAAGASAADLRPWRGGATPPLVLEDLQGRSHDLAAYRGKVVLVNFWATWCEPCRAEMPSMARLRSSLAGQPFEVLGVNMAEPLSRIEKFVAAVPVAFTLLRDRDGATAKAWRAKLLPASFLVDREGRIRYYVYGEVDWASEAVRAKVAGLLRSSASPTTAASERRSAAGANNPRLSLRAEASWR
ncbi:MAG TPA: TlpA disulfide reductase family protein [Burkholderiales bacterium]|nr:TlpA disulfide reductase family protein [Burkholderiales bacterium]